LGSVAGTGASNLALPVFAPPDFAPPTLGVPHPSAFVAEGWEANISRGPRHWASIYSLVYSISQQLPNGNGYITQKTRFPVRTMKTKGLFLRYPRKISLLKDLWRGISGAFELCKLLKTDGGLEMPCKISLVKDLWMPFWGKFGVLGPTAGAFQLSKSRSCSLLFIEQLM